jgi:hypothetical protein
MFSRERRTIFRYNFNRNFVYLTDFRSSKIWHIRQKTIVCIYITNRLLENHGLRRRPRTHGECTGAELKLLLFIEVITYEYLDN